MALSSLSADAETKIVSFGGEAGYEGIAVMDGGSQGFKFVVLEGGIERAEYLFLDRGYVPVEWDEGGDPIRFKKKEDGLLYWSDDSFTDRTPLNLESDLARDLLAAILVWFRESEYAGDRTLLQQRDVGLSRVLHLLEAEPHKSVDAAPDVAPREPTCLSRNLYGKE